MGASVRSHCRPQGWCRPRAGWLRVVTVSSRAAAQDWRVRRELTPPLASTRRLSVSQRPVFDGQIAEAVGRNRPLCMARHVASVHIHGQSPIRQHVARTPSPQPLRKSTHRCGRQDRHPLQPPPAGPHADDRARDRLDLRTHRRLPVPRNPNGKTLCPALRAPHRDGRERQANGARPDTGIAPAASALARPAPPGVAGVPVCSVHF